MTTASIFGGFSLMSDSFTRFLPVPRKQREHVPQHVVRAEHNERERNEEADPIDDLLVHARFRLLSSPQLICQLARVKTPSLQFVLGRSPKRGRRQARATMPRSIREEGAGHGR